MSNESIARRARRCPPETEQDGGCGDGGDRTRVQKGSRMLYHGCGRPILAVPLLRPISLAPEYLFFDGATEGRTSGEIQRCPGCGHELQPGDLSEKPGAASVYQDAG